LNLVQQKGSEAVKTKVTGRVTHGGELKQTDIANPDYFHKVVDCQWACPAHTPVPEDIRLIAAGRYSDAFMINWESNVFPGILGRTDRPCDGMPRGRVEEDPRCGQIMKSGLTRGDGDLPLEARRADLKDDISPPAAGAAAKSVGAGCSALRWSARGRVRSSRARAAPAARMRDLGASRWGPEARFSQSPPVPPPSP
jgi:hypothetical protein